MKKYIASYFIITLILLSNLLSAKVSAQYNDNLVRGVFRADLRNCKSTIENIGFGKENSLFSYNASNNILLVQTNQANLQTQKEIQQPSPKPDSQPHPKPIPHPKPVPHPPVPRPNPKPLPAPTPNPLPTPPPAPVPHQ